MAAFVTRLQPMMVAHPSRSSATGAIDNSPGGSYRHWPHTHTGRTSFDHLVCAGEQKRGYLDANRLGGFKIDDQFELVRCLDRQVGRISTAQDAIDIGRGAAVLMHQIDSVNRQSSVGRPVPERIDCRKVMT